MEVMDPKTGVIMEVNTGIPPVVDERIKRGKTDLDKEKNKRKECYAFARGEQFKFLDPKGALNGLPTSTSQFDRNSKPPHTFRYTRNLVYDIVEREVSATLERVPSYEISPSTTDPEDVGAARLAEKVALYGYDKWHIRKATELVVRHAAVADEGFAWPYFDNSVGPYIQTETGPVGQGEIRVKTFGRNQVSWEPGLSFEDSNWHAIESAREMQSVIEMDGFIGGSLKADAEGDGKLVLVTEYLERPSLNFPEGRWLTIANKRVIVGTRAYPCTDPKGEVIDEPVLHRLAYSTDAESGKGLGLVRQILDLQRTVNDIANRQLEWIRLSQIPKVIIRNGALKKGERWTNEPATVNHVEGNGDIEYVTAPQIPPALEEIRIAAISDMARIAAQNDVPQGVEAGRAISALIERDASRRANFTANLAEFHSRLMRHCLYLVQKHYTEERLVQIRGRFGPENEADFLGSQIRGQADVTVSPGSITPRTRESMESKALAFADRGWISPQEAMSAIDSGTVSVLIEKFELVKARANLLIQKIRDGSIDQMTPRIPFPDEQAPALDDTGQPIVIGQNPDGSPAYQQLTEIPGWMPRPFDNVSILKDQFEEWLMTTEYADLDPDRQKIANLIYAGFLRVEADQAAQAQAAQNAQAEQLGRQNAARPTDKQMPSQPSGQVFQPRYATGSESTF